MYAFLAFSLSLRMGGIAMSMKSQGSNMRRLSVLLSHDLGYAYGDKERGPNGRKKIFLNTGKAFLRALAKDLGLRDALVSANEGGIAVSGECTLIGMWEEGGIYICLSQPVGGGDKVLLYRIGVWVCGNTEDHSIAIAASEQPRQAGSCRSSSWP